MKLVLDKNILSDKLDIASCFISERNTSLPILQGIQIKGKKNELHFYSSNLNSSFHTKIKNPINKELDFIIEPRKILEFLSFLSPGKIEIEVSDKKIEIIQGKTKGTFALLNAKDFPLTPVIDGEGQKIKTKAFRKNLDQILFSAAKDEGRPVLTGVNFITNEEQVIVATDGFRLSLVKTPKQMDYPSIIVPAAFLEEVFRLIDDEEEVSTFFLSEEKMIVFRTKDSEFFSRLIEGDFPPFEKVIPEKYVTRTLIDRDEFIRAIKLISVFARELSNIVVLNFKKDGLLVRPKTDKQENSTQIESKMEGEDQTVAFNYKFLLDYLTHVGGDKKNIIIEILRPDAPVVFKTEDKSNSLHIIMPVRIQE